jgi:hypothetical protein
VFKSEGLGDSQGPAVDLTVLHAKLEELMLGWRTIFWRVRSAAREKPSCSLSRGGVRYEI